MTSHNLDAVAAALSRSFDFEAYSRVPKLTIPKITPLNHWMDGKSLFEALQYATRQLAKKAPRNHDVTVNAFGLSAENVTFMEPHALLFTGLDSRGEPASIVTHFTQLVASIESHPKRGSKRTITKFAGKRARG